MGMNQFEALCKLASEQNWCWKLSCTTCGHTHFRYAFQELARGKSPESKQWIIHGRNTQYSNRLGPLPRNYSDEQKEKFLQICLYANISSIVRNCKFPDWLGYLGLVLDHMYSRSNTFKAVSSNWASQLMDLVPQDSPAYIRLAEIVEDEGELLNIKDLEICETDLKNQNPAFY
ncbi:hypothetical protein ACFL0H_11615 [Thermodesulfobacteriota bacterium]